MNKQKFQKSLQNLNGWRECIFILALAERALPNALLYFDSIELTPSSLNDYRCSLSELVDTIWKQMTLEKDEAQDEELIVTLLDQIAAYVPDTQKNDHYGVLPTVDCLFLLEQALLTKLNNNKNRAQDASKFSIETVMKFIEFSEGDKLSENQLIKLFNTHPLIEREFSFQSELNDMLRATHHPSDGFLAELRALAQDEGVSNIGISLN